MVFDWVTHFNQGNMSTKLIAILILIAICFACTKETETDPRVETTSVKSIASNICYAKATVPEKGSYGLIDYGFVYSTYNGTFGLESGALKVSLGTTPMVADTFSTSFSLGYTYAETIYVKAYYTNKKGTVYGNAVSIKPLTLSINSVSPNAGKAGDKITIYGNNFSKNKSDNVVKFNNTVAKVTDASTTMLVVEVPNDISSSNYDASVPITITVGGMSLSWNGFMISPVVTGFSPTSGTFGTVVTFTGTNLYFSQIKINNILSYTNYNSNNSFQYTIPNEAKSSRLSMSIVKNGVETAIPGEFTMNPPAITSISQTKGFIGSPLSITGTGFNPVGYYNTVKFGEVLVSNPWVTDNTTINFYIPESLKPGTYDISVNNGIENAVLTNAFTVIEPKITGFTPASGNYNSLLTIQGENLANVQNVALGNNGYGNYGAEIISRDENQLVIRIPANIPTGNAKIYISAANKSISSSDDFLVLPPVITGFSPSEGTPGTIVTIKGNGFDSGQYYTSVKFGTVGSTVISVSPTEIKTIVPSDAPAGVMKLVVVTPWYTVASDNDFTVKK